jgi:hypothetical protein
MLTPHFYNEAIRKTVIAFGTIFNNIQIKKLDPSDGSVIEEQKVPLSYGPKQKFIVRLEENPDLRKVSITLPRLYFEMIGIEYDPSRKISLVQKCKSTIADNGNEVKTQYVPVPYDLNFELGIITKTQDDSLQIIEQILPYFQPNFNITVNFIPDMNQKKDVPIILNNIRYEDTWDDSFMQRRYITYILTFTAKSYIYGPTTDTGLIKKAITKEYTTTDIASPGRYREYSVTPKALEDKNNDTVIDALDDALLVSGDDFGFSETSGFFEDV